MKSRTTPPLFRSTSVPTVTAAPKRGLDIGQLMDLVQTEAVKRLADLARTVTGAPIAGINLLNEQRTIGLTSLGAPRRDHPAKETFCAHVIHQPDHLLIVEDATLDPRFAHLPVVTRTDGIRFYAGTAVFSPQGEPIATLFVMDTSSRSNASEQTGRMLTTLSAALTARLELVQQIEALNNERAKFRAFMDSGPVAAFMKDTEGAYVYVNQRFLTSFNLREADVIGKRDHDVWPKEIADAAIAHDRWVMTHQESAEVIEQGPPDERGEPTWWQSYKFVVPGTEPLLGGVSLDVSELRSIQERLKRTAITDALTGLPNRVDLERQLTEAIELCRHRQRLMCVMFMDLDKFKSVNDTFGHESGDQLLVEFGLRLKRAVRHTDTVFRLAGDEFVVMLEGLQSAAEAEKVAQKILDAMKDPVHLAGQPFVASTSIGIAMLPDVETTAQALLAMADQALYEVKRTQRGQYRFA